MKSFFRRISSHSSSYSKDTNDSYIPQPSNMEYTTSSYLTPHMQPSNPVMTSNRVSSKLRQQTKPQTPIVIELFQSQGCNSCPPTNANLLSLISTSNITSSSPPFLLLTHHVTYWDYLGWKDTFGDKAADRRQRDYVAKMGLRSAFTPQVIVQGAASGVGNTEKGLAEMLREGTIEMENRSARVKIEALSHEEGEENVISVTDTAGAGRKENLHVTLMMYDPVLREVDIKKGENGGRVLPHGNVVKEIIDLGVVERRSGQAVWQIGPEIIGLKRVVLVQDGRGGNIMGVRLL